ncbi:toprim domain-containing protein [Pseudoalteromonas sp. JSTW]|uniref:toprim domain-containing protein n=1 Tax=Pseudoalteromonas sp. JSTW TaxID=2752475 RepID=UPI0015D52B87|nr:toprim domain-containing protein [Pseudoalteromonas sp. JSTW]QLJ07236.1 toprim domain-containing protein [Pseudoalteromonas sp. JSTW]
MQPSINNDWLTYSPSTLISHDSELHYADKLLAFYQKALYETPRALKFVTQDLGLSDESLLAKFSVGFCDRKFPIELPSTDTLEGEMARGFYERLGIINGLTGHEAFRGMIFVPLFDNNGELIGGYGQRIEKYPLSQRGDTLWSLAHGVDGYFFNQQILGSYNQIVLCESPFDVLSFNLGGVINAISLLDFTYFDDEHLCQLLEHNVREVTLAFSRTPRGDRYVAHVRRKLLEVDIKVKKLEMVVGESVNSLWAQSQRFGFVLSELNGHQRCHKNYH